MPARPKRGSGERSNWYSGAKFTNWTPFDPYWSEAKATQPFGRPSVEVPRSPSPPLPVFARTPHPEFVHPCTAGNIRETLERVPSEFLHGLEAVFFLPGTKKQIKALKLFRYGCYSASRIYLHAFPAVLREQHFRAPLKPSVAREYERAGARISHEGGSYAVKFDEPSLCQFYLYDVLLHEVGHHVDTRLVARPNRDAERFAEWFAEAEAQRLRDSR